MVDSASPISINSFYSPLFSPLGYLLVPRSQNSNDSPALSANKVTVNLQYIDYYGKADITRLRTSVAFLTEKLNKPMLHELVAMRTYIDHHHMPGS